MRTFFALALALGLGAPVAAYAADTGVMSDLSQLVGAYQHVHSVRVIETFENGSAATVDILPDGQFRIAETGGQDAGLVMKIATQPVGGALTSSYAVTPAGKKTIEGVKATGYKLVAPDGTYSETVWVNDHHLPISAHVDTPGESVDVIYGDYNDTALVAHP